MTCLWKADRSPKQLPHWNPICAGIKDFFPAQKGECTDMQGLSCGRKMTFPQEVRSVTYHEDLPPDLRWIPVCFLWERHPVSHSPVLSLHLLGNTGSLGACPGASCQGALHPVPPISILLSQEPSQSALLLSSPCLVLCMSSIPMGSVWMWVWVWVCGEGEGGENHVLWLQGCLGLGRSPGIGNQAGKGCPQSWFLASGFKFWLWHAAKC